MTNKYYLLGVKQLYCLLILIGHNLGLLLPDFLDRCFFLMLHNLYLGMLYSSCFEAITGEVDKQGRVPEWSSISALAKGHPTLTIISLSHSNLYPHPVNIRQC